MFIIISGIIIILVLGFCCCDSLIKYYIANVLSNEFKWGEKNNEVLLKIIKDTLHKEYSEIIGQTISKKVDADIECLGFSIKHKLNNIDYRLDVYGQFEEKIEQMKSALEKYANSGYWFVSSEFDGDCVFLHPDSNGYEIAQQVLKEIEEMK